MRKTVLTILGALLIAGSTVQMTAAAERHVRKADRTPIPTSQQFRNANDSLAWRSVEQQSLSDYSEGHVISAPAGR
jgi:hypothetical protein